MAAEDFDIYVFDLDGTLLNTLEDLYLATNAAMRHVGAAERTKDEVRAFVGNGIKLLITRALGERAADEAVFNRAFSYFKEYYGAHMYDHTAPYAGVLEMLRRLNAAKKRVAVRKGFRQALRRGDRRERGGGDTEKTRARFGVCGDRAAGRRKGGVYRRFGSGYRNGEKRGIAVYFGVLGV